MKIGDEVKLTDAYAACLMKTRSIVKTSGGRTFDWKQRRGRIAHISRTYVGVQWTDRKSVDLVSAKALEILISHKEE